MSQIITQSRTAGQKSSLSQLSHGSHSLNLQEAEMTDEELIQLVNDGKQQVKLLTIENEILEQTIMRLDPNLMQGIAQAIELAANLLSHSSMMNIASISKSQSSKFFFAESTTSRMMLSPSRASSRKIESSAKLGGSVVFGSGPKVNVLERAELVSTEMEIVIRNLEKVKRNAAKQQGFLKAQLEEVGLRVADIEKAEQMFKQYVTVDGWDPIAQRIPAEIWIRFMTEWVKICDSQIGKLRLRTSTLNTQHSKFKGQIKAKAELSESLRPVDFEKLEIENSECIKLIEQKLQQLEELKKMTGDANLNLTMHKKAMMAQNTYLTNVLNSIKEKEAQTVQLDKERNLTEAQADSLAQKLEEVRKIRLAYEVPDVLDYVRVKNELAELKNANKTLENRLHIKQIALASMNKKLHTMLKKDVEDKM